MENPKWCEKYPYQREGLSRVAWNHKKKKLAKARKWDLENGTIEKETGRHTKRRSTESRIKDLLTKDDNRLSIEQAEGMGKGVFWRGEECLPPNKNLLAYCSDTASNPAAEVGEKRKRKSCYLVDTEMDGIPWMIDGTNSMRVGPHINHSSTKGTINLRLKKFIYNHKPVAILQTIKEIKPGDQLFWDYYSGTKPSEAEKLKFPFL